MQTGIRLITIVALVFLPAWGCTKSISDRDIVLVDPPQALELTAGKKKGVLGLAGRGETAFVDCRPKHAFAAGHIEGAIHMPIAEAPREHEQLNAYTVIIVYGTTWNDPVAQAMSKRLMDLGHKDVRTLRGGYEGWVDSENPVVPGTE
ncbi:MAG: rhodanese-like domain-containing protein [Planctomycetota bacterium]|jgi:rhodanese-related sulfurtransferase